MSKPIKFQQKNGLTVYALACGYLQTAKLQTGELELRVTLEHTGGNCYHVTAYEHGGRGQLHYSATESIGHARKVWAEWVERCHGVHIKAVKADKRYGVAQEFCGEREAMYVARWEGKWLGKSQTAAGAWLLAYADLRSRLDLIEATAPAVNETDLAEFTRGYQAALYWSSTDVVDGEDVNLDQYDTSTAADDECRADCRAFYIANRADIDKAAKVYDVKEGTGYDYAGHDFALTRNGHGAGFWDGDLPGSLGERLTAASKAAGEVHPYIGDDGLVHL